MPADARSAPRPRRQFWLHQVAEYVVGLALVATGLQAPEPLVPAVLGGIVLVNVAMVDGPLSAFDMVPRRVHRVLDWLVVVLILVAAAAPVADGATRILLVPFAIVLAVVARQTGYGPSRRTVATEDGTPTASRGQRAEDAGRAAGRLVGRTVQGVRRPRDGS